MKTSRSRFGAISALATVVLLVGACAPAPATPAPATPTPVPGVPEALRICFIHEDLETEFWLAAHKAMTETLRGKGHEVLERYGPDATRQLELLRDCIVEEVDASIVIPKDGAIALTLIEEANKANIPIGIFNRPPLNEEGAAIVVQSSNRDIARDAVQYLADEVRKQGRTATPLILVGDLGDPNAVLRKDGFYDVINANKDLFNLQPDGRAIEVATDWDAATASANLRAAMTANPQVDFIFTSSDFLFPTIQGILEPMGKWVTRGDPNHVLMAGVDGDVNACRQIRDGYVGSTGVQDVFAESQTMMDAILEATAAGETRPDVWLFAPGFALTAGNFAEREMDMWGCQLLAEQE